MRNNGRKNDELRSIKFVRDYIIYPEGSILIESENTKILCNVSILENQQPPHLKNTNKGWITAEYSLLPRSTIMRINREVVTGKIKGRTYEIQRLIGRALRAIIELEAIGPTTVWIDCDVLQADGGTRTASINGAFLALVLAMKKFKEKNKIEKQIIRNYLSAISVGIVNNEILLDLNFEEDNKAQVDMNVVMDAENNYIEIQTTAEKKVFNQEQLLKMLDYAKKGCNEIIELEKVFLTELGINELP
ncbi:MAG TPA: ribonuclease PH [bacterium]|nr:ribonuclease PH [bacterium]HOL47752.1 ribonuclease PH [bacterium]HPQ17704.1 ribonuclease PH [bacterium]